MRERWDAASGACFILGCLIGSLIVAYIGGHLS